MQKAIAPARKLSLLPGLLFRTAPAGAVQLETRCVTGHHRRLGEKYQAIQCMQGQEHLWEYYTRVALQRGVQAKRNIGITAARDIVHGEAFQSIFPA